MLTPLELDIMKAVWRKPPVAVRDVQEAIRPSRILAYTTVMTIMDRLYHKGFLTRKLQSRTHFYEPSIAYAEVRDEALRKFLEYFFDGSPDRLREFLNGESAEDEDFLVTPPEVSGPTALDETLL